MNHPQRDPRPTVAAPDDDPYLWLEDINGARALAWVEARNAATSSRFGDFPFNHNNSLVESGDT